MSWTIPSGMGCDIDEHLDLGSDKVIPERGIRRVAILDSVLGWLARWLDITQRPAHPVQPLGHFDHTTVLRDAPVETGTSVWRMQIWVNACTLAPP